MADEKRLQRGRTVRVITASITVVVVSVAVSVVVNAVTRNVGDVPALSSSAWAVAGTLVAFLAITLARLISRSALTVPGAEERGISDRADQARDHLSAAAQLLDELGDELAARIRLLEQHQADAERYKQLASLNAEQAKAIEGLVGRQFARQSRLTWMQFGGSLVAAFVLGLVVNWISQPALAWLTGS
ncbi:hypothetical protein [Saccharothrix syringae]|uniref:Uncharacterized protein n=1 Tax=Saccharothrix syringae TaxID=103733 RepID=A0A5Q0H2N8_SACSY|nr:hypothetical protein [Saccharothrix syringae]QFZ20486.1 hypothetical protein EKG83_26505 [Saccharothrix syringae]